MINRKIHKEPEDQRKNLLQNSEKLFIKTFHASPDAFIISRLTDGTIIEINRSAEVLFGYSKEELIGKTSVELGLFADPDERQIAVNILKSDGFLRDFILAIKRKSGEMRHVSLAVEILDLENENLMLTSARDITERKQMQEAISYNEERYRSTLDSMIEGCAIIGFDWTYIYVNEANARHAHKKREDMIGRNMLEIIPGIEKSIFYSSYKKCMEERTRQQVEAKFIFADGSSAWYEAIAQPVPEGIFVISMDITARKRAEEALRKSEEHYHTLFNAIDEGFCVIQMLFDENEKPIDYRFLEINPAFEKQSGLTNVQGKRMRELAPMHEELWFEIYGNVALTGKPVRFQNLAEQLQRWFDVYAFSIGSIEERKVAVLFNDITESKQTQQALFESEERFSKAFLVNPSALLISRINDGMIIDVNESFLKLFGYTRDEVIGKSVGSLNLAEPEDIALVINLFRKDTFLRDFEIKIRRKNGEEGAALFSIEIFNMRGEQFILSSIQDITERKKAEEALRESEERQRLVLDAANLGTWDLDLITDTAVRSFRHDQIWGYAEPQQVWGFDIAMKNVVPEDRPGILEAYEHGISSGLLFHENRVIWPDGSIHWIRAYGRFRYNNEGQPVRVIGIVEDITERKKAEETITRIKDQYELLFNSIGEGFAHYKAIYDENGRLSDLLVLDINPAGAEFSGVKREEQIGKTWKQVWIGIEDYLFDIYRDVDQTGKPFIFEHFSGITNKWYLTRIYKIAQDSFAVTFFDITKRKKAEEELRINEAAMEAFFNASTGILNLFDRELRYVKCDPITPTYYGLDQKSIIGKSLADLNPPFAEQFLRPMMKRVIESGKPVMNLVIESPVPSRGGETGYWLVSYFPVPLSQVEMGLGVMGVEITEIKRAGDALRESEAKLIDAQKLARFGNYTIDVKNNNTIEWSDQMYDLWELDRNKPIPSFEELWNLIHPDDRGQVKKAFDEAAIENQKAETEFRILFPGNRTKYIKLISRIFTDESGNIIKRQGVEIDITETKAAQLEIKEAYNQLAERLKEKEVLLRELYHRTKNNLQVISSLLSLKAAALPDPGLQNILQDIQDKIRAIALVHEKLYRSRNLSRVNLHEYIIELINLFKVSHSINENISFRYDIDQISVQIDVAIPCGLIITELIQNSLKYAFPGNKRGYIEIKLKRLEDQSILLIISDNGIGLIEADLKKEDKLGLHLVKDIAQNQLDAVINLNIENGVSWSLQFNDIFYDEGI